MAKRISTLAVEFEKEWIHVTPNKKSYAQVVRDSSQHLGLQLLLSVPDDHLVLCPMQQTLGRDMISMDFKFKGPWFGCPERQPLFSMLLLTIMLRIL